MVRTEFADMHIDIELLAGEFREAFAAFERWESLAEQLQSVPTHLELLKGELRALATALEDIGFAIAPGAGLVGVPDRFAELRERVNAIDRRVRLLADGAKTASRSSAPEDREAEPARGGSGFDYVGFELRFRGDPDVVRAETEARYLELLAANPPVLDVGCGRGELIDSLARAGVPAVGVDLDEGMVAEARAAGREVVLGDAIGFLRSQPANSFGSICAIQVVEHLDLDTLVELLELACSRLRPGGIFVAETPNPTTLVVLGNSYILDPTHVWPLHPSLLTFLCERAGFRDVRLRFEAPATDYQLPLLEAGVEAPAWVSTVNESFDRLNQVLFGPQDYAVIARSPD